MKEELEARLAELIKQTEQLLADLNYVTGMKDEVRRILSTLEGKVENAN